MGKVNNALRMLAILRSRKKVTRRELAEELEVDIREITRYKEDLEYAGVTITESRGKYGGYILENKDYLLNLELSDKESLALSKTKDYLKGQGVHFYNDLSLAIEKILSINPKSSNYFSENIYSKGNITERTIHPYRLYTYYGANYFIGKCEVRDALRQFKLVRIQDINLLDDKFEKDDFDLNNYLKNTIGLFKDEKYEIKLRINYPYAMSFKEYSWTQDEHIEDYMEEGYLIYTATIEGKTKIISWIMGMGTSCTVLEPKELVEDVIKEHKKVLNNYK